MITPSGYRSAIVVFAVLAVVFFVATYALTKERVRPIAAQSSSWKRDALDLLRNYPWLILVAVTVIKQAFAGVRGSMIVYYFKYYVHNEPLSAMYLMLGSLASIAGIYLVQFLPERYGKKVPYIVSITLAGVFSVLSYWVRPTDYTAMFVYQILINFFMGPPTSMLWALYADAADYSELKTGRRATGLIFSASTMSQKLGWTIASSVGLYVLGYYHFQANVEQTPETLNGLCHLVSMIPAACCFGAAAIMCLIRSTTVGSWRSRRGSGSLAKRRPLQPNPSQEPERQKRRQTTRGVQPDIPCSWLMRATFHPLPGSRADYRIPVGKRWMVSSFQKETGATKEPPRAKI